MRATLQYGDKLERPTGEAGNPPGLFVWAIDLVNLEVRSYSRVMSETMTPLIRCIPLNRVDEWKIVKKNYKGRVVTYCDGSPLTMEMK